MLTPRGRRLATSAGSCGRGVEPVGRHRHDLLVERWRHLGDGEALGERDLVVRLGRRGAQPGQHVAHVVAGGDLVVARRDLQAAVALDVPAEDAGIDDEASMLQPLAQRFERVGGVAP